jgi:hypothetical protein
MSVLNYGEEKMLIRLNPRSALSVLGLSLVLSGAMVAQEPGNKNQPGPRPQNNPNNPPANNNSNSSGAKFGAQGSVFGGLPVTGLPPALPPGVTAPAGMLPNQSGPYGSMVPGYIGQGYPPPIMYPGSMPQNELMVYQEGEFKVIQNTNDPNQLVEAREALKLLSEAVQALRSESTKESERADAKKTLTQYLRAHFDHDEKKRREQVESLEAQVVKLKAQLEKRTQSKEQLIDLRLKLLENDASGLAFPQSWSMLPGMENGGQWMHSYSFPSNNYPVNQTYNQMGVPSSNYPSEGNSAPKEVDRSSNSPRR